MHTNMYVQTGDQDDNEEELLSVKRRIEPSDDEDDERNDAGMVLKYRLINTIIRNWPHVINWLSPNNDLNSIPWLVVGVEDVANTSFFGILF